VPVKPSSGFSLLQFYIFLNSHAPVEVGILLIFSIRDTDTYPVCVSTFISFNYGYNSETLWGHCYELFDGKTKYV
jgi:hypothetical protein